MNVFTVLGNDVLNVLNLFFTDDALLINHRDINYLIVPVQYKQVCGSGCTQIGVLTNFNLAPFTTTEFVNVTNEVNLWTTNDILF